MDRVQTLLFQLRDFFLALPPARRVSFIGLTVGVLVGTIAMAVWLQTPRYQVLFSSLDPSDSGQVIDYLKAEKIPYRVDQEEGRIEVVRSQVHEVRMALATRGIPQGGGVGFELFDKQTLGMTDFVQRLGFQRALQGELARTISELSAVESARVHLAMPERSLFVADERQPSASVVVRLRSGRALDLEQVDAIVHLVAGSVEGLRPSEVTVVDVGGNVLTRDLKQGSRSAAQTLQTYQHELEEMFVLRIESMLERVLGPGHAVARVSVDLDRASVEETHEKYDPDATAVRSERRTTESNTEAAAMGVPGVNATLTNEPAESEAAGPQSEREDAQFEYEISKHVSRRTETLGALRRLSVAVLVDGVSQPGTDENAKAEFLPRPQEELDRYQELVKRAVGFDEDRGDDIEVISAPFHVADPIALEAPGLLAQVGSFSEEIWRFTGLALILIVAMFVVRPFLLAMVGRAPLAAPEPVAAQLEGGAAAPNLALPGPNAQRLGITEMARENPEQTAMVIKQWVDGTEAG